MLGGVTGLGWYGGVIASGGGGAPPPPVGSPGGAIGSGGVRGAGGAIGSPGIPGIGMTAPGGGVTLTAISSLASSIILVSGAMPAFIMKARVSGLSISSVPVRRREIFGAGGAAGSGGRITIAGSKPDRVAISLNTASMFIQPDFADRSKKSVNIFSLWWESSRTVESARIE